MLDKVRILLDGKEYFKVNSITIQEVIEQFLSVRTANINGLFNGVKLREFESILGNRGTMLMTVMVNGKIWQQHYLNKDNYNIDRSASGGFVMETEIRDPFYGLLNSGVIDVYNVTHKTLQIALSRTIKELGFVDFKIKNGTGITNIDLKNGGNLKSIKGGSASQLIGGMCSLYNVLLQSNGLDTITIQKHNGEQSVIDNIYALVDKDGVVYKSNTQFVRKNGEGESLPARLIILNSAKTKDKNATSVIVPFKNGIPFTQQIKNVHMQASYKQIATAINYQMMGMTARANSYTYSLPSKIFDKNGDFFASNRIVSVYDEEMGIDQNMNIVGFSTTIDAQSGGNTTLNLVNQQAFDNLDNIKIKKSILK